jgi:hypothetical protein
MKRSPWGMFCFNHIFLIVNMFLLDFALDILLVSFTCKQWRTRMTVLLLPYGLLATA